jgi:hypothetical protein
MTASPSLPLLVAPNTEIVDDTPNALLSRVVARIQAKGAGVQGIYTDGWTGNSRVWMIDVTPSADDLDTDALGAVTVHEKRIRVPMPVARGIAVGNRGWTTKVTTAVGFYAENGGTTEALRTRLGWRAEVE